MSIGAGVRVMDSGAGVVVGLSTLLLAGVGVGGYLLWKHLENKPAPTPALPSPTAPTPGSSPIAPAPAPQAQPNLSGQLQAIQDSLAAADAARREAEVRQLIGSIAAYDNLLVRKLTEIDAIENDNSRYQDFRTQYIQDQKTSGRWQSLTYACSDAVGRNCGGSLFGLGRCAPDNQPGCLAESAIRNGYFRGDWNGNTDVNPWIIVSREADDPTVEGSAPRRLAQWKATARKPLEADLMVYETQWRGLVQELKDRYGLDYQPTLSPNDVYRAVALAQTRRANPNPPLNLPPAQPPSPAPSSASVTTPSPAPRPDPGPVYDRN